MTNKLTATVWQGLVKTHLRPAYRPQWTDMTDGTMDFCGKMLVEDKWTCEQAAWCVGQVVRYYRRLDNILAMLQQVNDGRTNHGGETVGGWKQSNAHHRLNAACALVRDQQKCIEFVRDGSVRRNCGKLPKCVGCPENELPGSERGTGWHSKSTERADNWSIAGKVVERLDI